MEMILILLFLLSILYGVIGEEKNSSELSAEAWMHERIFSSRFQYGGKPNRTHGVLLHQEAAKLGNATSQFRLGTLYATGSMGMKHDISKAILYYYFAALGGNTGAQMALGFRHSIGAGVPKNCYSAVAYYELAANSVAEELEATGVGPLNERERISLEKSTKGRSSLSRNENEDIIDYYRHAADKGEVTAQIALGQIYFYGARGVQRNFRLAAKYYGLASATGDPQAQAHLGHLLVKGLGTPVDLKNAFGNFSASADSQNGAGHNGLGYMYLHGYGVKQDLKLALKHFTDAAEQGNTEAFYNLGALHVAGVGVRHRDYVTAMNYFTLALRSSHTLAMHKLAQMHLHGIGTAKSCDTALQLFKAVSERGESVQLLSRGFRQWSSDDLEGALHTYLVAAEMGYEVAQSNAAWLLEFGVPLNPDSSNNDPYHQVDVVAQLTEYMDTLLDPKPFGTSESLRLYELSATQGNVESRLKIGDFYYYGLANLSSPNYELAAQHYQLASNLQNAQATYNLGYMHQYGVGLPKDFWLAKRFYDAASQISNDARIPVSLALAGLRIHRLWEETVFGSDTTTTSAAAASSESQQHPSRVVQEPHMPDEVESSQESFNFEDMLDSIENMEDDTIWAIVLFVILCVVLYFRTREQQMRMMRNGEFQQPRAD